MEPSRKSARRDVMESNKPALRFLVESALREVISARQKARPRTHDEWVVHLAEALMSESDAPHHAVLAALMSNGVSREDIFRDYVPAASRHLGALWVSDKATFVDVTVGASRLQQLFRSTDARAQGPGYDRAIPLGHAVLMVIPRFEDHSLGAFVAADRLRRHGLWVRMCIGLNDADVANLIGERRFSMVGLSLATPNSIEKAGDLVEFVRRKIDGVPPVVVGGRAVEHLDDAATRCGADHSARSAREAIEVCGLSAIAQSSAFADMC